MMWGSRVSLGLLVVLSLLAHLGQSARMVARDVSLHASLTATQQQFRKESMKAENSLVCGTTTIKTAINARKGANGIPDINWPKIQKTAAVGMAKIMSDISGLKNEIAELDARFKELLESEKYGDLPRDEIDDMIKASCDTYNAELKHQGEGCELAKTTNCGYDVVPKINAPFDGPVDSFTQRAESKMQKYTTLDMSVFMDACSENLSEDGGCPDLCDEFSYILEDMFSAVHEESATNLANTDTSDDVAKQIQEKTDLLTDKEADKNACQTAQGQLKDFADQLNMLSSTVKDTKRATRNFRKALRGEEVRLDEQIIELARTLALLEKAKSVFADATAQAQQRQADVDTMIAELKKLEQALAEQREKIRQLVEHLGYLENALEAGRLFKAQLSRVLVDAVAYNNEAVTKPLCDLGMSPKDNIVKSFDDAEAAAAPAMKKTVNAVGDYCGSQNVLAALNGVQVEASQKLNYICTGQNWNNMIKEAQETVKKDAKTVVDILLQEQAVAVADEGVPSGIERDYSLAESEPVGLRQALSVLGDKEGTFIKGYVYPGWSATLQTGNVGDVGKMLKLYQKLGEVFETVTEDWKVAQEGEKRLIEQVTKTAEQVETLKKLLQAAIKAQEFAKDRMDIAQGIVDKAEATKKVIEENVATAEQNNADGNAAYSDAQDAFMAEHKARSDALLQLFQELQKQQ